MLEEYLQAHGREWERFAWLKSRVVAPRASVESGRALALKLAGHRVRLPPLSRLRRLRRPAPAARQGARRSAAARRRPAGARQRRQALARRHPRDRIHRPASARRARRPVPRDPHPLDAEGARQARRRRPDAAAPTAERLADAYTLLRRIEHRIQYLDDQQTHILPTARRRPRLDRRQPRPLGRRRHLLDARPARRRARDRRRANSIACCTTVAPDG